MNLIYHGGFCCGIKTIHALYSSPSSQATEIKEATRPQTSYGGDVTDGTSGAKGNWFVGNVPKETYLERLDRYLQFTDSQRQAGVLEIVLADNASDSSAFNQNAAWQFLLEERGFKLVTKCRNSNTNNNIYIYHRAKE
jgi:hypothetical protein